MAYGRGGRRRYDPRADERREREAKDLATIERHRSRLARLLRQYRMVFLRGSASDHAWGQREVRSFHVGRTSSGDWIIVTLRTDGRQLFLQQQGGMGWDFFRLDPKNHVLRREDDWERR